MRKSLVLYLFAVAIGCLIFPLRCAAADKLNSVSQGCTEAIELPFGSFEAWAPFYDRIARGFAFDTGPGYAILDTNEWFPEESFDDFFESLPKGVLFSTWPKKKSTLRISGITHSKKGYFLHFGKWLRRALLKSLPEEVDLQGPVHELWAADYSTRPHLGWHMDAGVYITAVVYAKGAGMRGATESGEFQVPRGKIILFTSEDRAEQFKQVEALYHASSNLFEAKLAAIYFFYRSGHFPNRKSRALKKNNAPFDLTPPL